MDLHAKITDQQLDEWMEQEGLVMRTVSETREEAEDFDLGVYLDSIDSELKEEEKREKTERVERMEVVIGGSTPPPPPNVDGGDPLMNRDLLQAMVVIGRKAVLAGATHPDLVGVLHPTDAEMTFAQMEVLPEIWKMNAKGAPVEQDAVWCWADYDWLVDLKQKQYDKTTAINHHFVVPVFCPPPVDRALGTTARIVTATWDDDCGPWTNLSGTPGPWSLLC